MTRCGLLKAYQVKNSRVMENPCADPICREAFRPPRRAPAEVRFSLADILAITNSQVMQRFIPFPFNTFLFSEKSVNITTGIYGGLKMFILGIAFVLFFNHI